MRLFVALDLPDDVRASLSSFVTQLQKTCSGPRWVRLEGVHITLKFLGEVPEEKIAPIAAALAQIQGLPSVGMRFTGLGFFPNEKRPRVFWAGIESGPELAGLASAVEKKLEPLGFPIEERAYHPHITLARLESMQGADALRTAATENANKEFGRAIDNDAATEFYLYRSVLKRGGAEYTRLSAYRFAGDHPS